MSVTSQSSFKTGEIIELVFSIQATSTYPTLCLKEIQVNVSPKITVLPSVTLSLTLNLAHFPAFSPQHVDHHKCCHHRSTDDRR